MRASYAASALIANAKQLAPAESAPILAILKGRSAAAAVAGGDVGLGDDRGAGRASAHGTSQITPLRSGHVKREE